MKEAEIGGIAIQKTHVLGKTRKDGTLSLARPLGKPEAQCDVLVAVQPGANGTTPPPGEWRWPFEPGPGEGAARAGRQPGGLRQLLTRRSSPSSAAPPPRS